MGRSHHALDTYQWYWYGGGKDLELDYNEAYYQDKAIRANIDKEIADAQTGAEELFAATGLTSFDMSGSAIESEQYAVTENWQKAIGGHLIWSSASVTVDEGKITIMPSCSATGLACMTGATRFEVHGAQLAWCKEYGTLDCVGAIAKSVQAAKEAAALEIRLLESRLSPEVARGRANAFQHGYWMALLVGELGFSAEKALSLGVAHELDHPNPVHHYGHPNSDVDLRNNVGGVVIGGSVKPTWRKLERGEYAHDVPSGLRNVHGAAMDERYVQEPIGPTIRERVMQAVTPGACSYCLDLTGF